jgi:mRNA-degrading endonuclease RelE of RelBE toxin-antitoxin system
MKLVIEKLAARRLMDLPPKARASLRRRLDMIAAEPFGGHANVQPLKGEKDLFRLRQAEWRAVYRIDRDAGEVRVMLIEPRGSVYR